jgi:hypothetical protein
VSGLSLQTIAVRTSYGWSQATQAEWDAALDNYLAFMMEKPSWWTPEFSAFDHKLLHVFGVTLDPEDLPELYRTALESVTLEESIRTFESWQRGDLC